MTLESTHLFSVSPPVPSNPGYPDPEVQWLKGEVELEEQPSHVTVDYEEDGSCSLRLERAEAKDSGVYTCRAVNDQGEAVCSVTLTVKN